MKLWKIILLILFGIIILAQIPFIYNRYKFGRLADKINLLQTQRAETANPNFNDFTGIIHAHTSLGAHSTGRFAELIEGGAANNLDFVVMTEHIDPLYDTSALTLHGVYKNVLFVDGQEVPTATDRFLQLQGRPKAGRANLTNTPAYLQKTHAQSKLAIISYPEKFKSWNSDFDGIEVLNLHTNAQKINPVAAFFDLLWSYPELVLADYLKRPDDNLRQCDELTKTRKLTATAAAAAHSNTGFHLFGDDAEHKFINIKIDSYETIFQLVRNHVLLEKDKPLTQDNLLQAIKNGHLFIGVDALGDIKGFVFTAENGAETKITGDEITLSQGVNFKISAPLAARIVVFKNGERVFEASDTTETAFHVQEQKTYGAEVYLRARFALRCDAVDSLEPDLCSLRKFALTANRSDKSFRFSI